MPKDITKKGEKSAKKVVVVEEVSDESVSENIGEQNPQNQDKESETKNKQSETESTIEKISDEKQDTNNFEVLETKSEEINLGRLMWIIIPTTLLVGALAGGIITYFSGISSIQPENSPTPLSTPISEPETEQPEENADKTEIKREELKIQVLNGSGIAGAAGKAADFLESLGYKDVKTGNAEKSDYENVYLSIKKEKESYKELLIGDLEKEYTLSDETETLEASSSYDVVIILGS